MAVGHRQFLCFLGVPASVAHDSDCNVAERCGVPVMANAMLQISVRQAAGDKSVICLKTFRLHATMA